ncbi:putative Endomembrane protein 70 [Leishmania naiffi]|uniref:Transmembrane 9 superfamily member n=1 Tax=Leishmania naiffi TaxID=5678 RepID=A0AAW3BIT1_9TRYP
MPISTQGAHSRWGSGGDAWRPLLLLPILVVLHLFAVAATPANAFYVPGAAETSYKAGDVVKFMANTLRSSSEMFPIDYAKMPFCQPATLEFKEESIGEIIWGDRMLNSLYAVKMLEDVKCMPLPGCDVVANNEKIHSKGAKTLSNMINKWYRVYMNIDNLPVFSTDPERTQMSKCAQKLGKDIRIYAQRGFPLGLPSKCTSARATLLNNHLDFTIHYNIDSKTTTTTPEMERKYIVVFIEVKARSIAWNTSEECNKEMDIDSEVLESTRSLRMRDVSFNKAMVYWTYSVKWKENSKVKWATRWDFYLTAAAAAAPAGHILFIILSLMVVLFVGSAVVGALLRALHKDFNRYNSEDPDDLQEEMGWKLIHADVFRPPPQANWLAIFVANGLQILTTVAVVLIIALMGFLSPSRRGALLTTLLLTAVFTSLISGYVCGVLLQYLNCRAWKHIFTCSLTLPGAMLLMYFLILIINKSHGATTAIPFATLLEVLALFIAVSLPLTVLGGSLAFREQPLTNPTRVGRLAREIPAQSFINQPIFTYVFWPTVPLIVAVIELYYIMQDLWEGQIYYSFGFLTVTASIWVLVCALVTVSCLYYVLCYENHRWWWIAYLAPGGAGVHMFCMSAIFFASQVSVSSFASAVLYFAYMGMVSYMYGMAAGAVGVICSIVFVRKIYSSIKID